MLSCPLQKRRECSLFQDARGVGGAGDFVPVAWWRGCFPKSTWGVVVMLVGGAIASMRSGEVEDIVGEHNLEAHEEAAKVCTGAGVVVAFMMLVAALLRGPRASQSVLLCL